MEHGLGLYNVTARSAEMLTGSSISTLSGLASLVNRTDGALVAVRGCEGASFRVDFGTESAGWLELLSDDIPTETIPALKIGISETNVRLPGKVYTPVEHPGGVFRLETAGNWEIYEGVRFGFVQIGNTCNTTSEARAATWHIRGVHVVAQALPVPYAGHFSSRNDNRDSIDSTTTDSDSILSQVWWAGALTSKLTMGTDQLGDGPLSPSTFMNNALLVDRGDRYGWTGDDHVSQATVLAAFGQYEFVRQSLWNTHNNSDSIAAYNMWWCLSVTDHYTASGDTATLMLYAYNIDAKLRAAIAVEGSGLLWGHGKNRVEWDRARPHIDFVGWDERIGAGFEFSDESDEAARLYSMLAARASITFASALDQV